VSGSGIVSGCAATRDPINRVQGVVVDKSFFLGNDLKDFRDDPEFRTKAYNIDSPANTDSFAATIGGASAVDRVRWELQENLLIAHRSYQEAPGADGRGMPRKLVDGKWEFSGPASGTVVAAYAITQHFDVRRDYNSQTGEETNVLVENAQDRLWQDRQFMRVDWSKNLALTTSSGELGWLFGEGAESNPVEYITTDETSDDRTRFEYDPNDDKKQGYLDVTNQYQVKPQVNPQFGTSDCVMMGFFNGSASFDCSPTLVRVRHSFVRLTGEEDFEPFEESVAPLDVVGNWGNAGNNFQRNYGAPPRTTWDPQYGFTDAKTQTFYAFHNLWEKSHQAFACTDNTDSNKDGTADACANETTGYTGANSGSQCDVYVGKCTIPVRDRSVKTIGYWLNADAPQELTDDVNNGAVTRRGAFEESTYTWNQMLRVAVATRREVECRRTGGGNRDQCHALYFEGQGPNSTEMVAFGGWGIPKVKDQEVDQQRPAMTTCHNPVREYDPKMCGEVGEKVRLGDMRKNYAIYWPYASRAPYGGVASIGGDPLTGEMLGATATTMMRSATAAAAQQRDIIQLALGDLKIEDFIEGVQASRYADALKTGQLSSGLAKGKTNEEIAALVANVQHGSIRAALGESAPAANLSAMQRQLATAKLQATSAPTTATTTAADLRANALLAQLDKTPYARDVANRGLMRVVAEAANQSAAYRSTATFNAINQTATKSPSELQDVFDKFSAYMGNKGVCFQDATSAAGSGSLYQPALAPYFKKLYGSLNRIERGKKIYNDLLREAVKGIAFHEIGHSLGMRHNFASSWDSMNYAPQYWQLRTNEGKSTEACTGARAGGADTCMGPRYLDPMTDDEQGLGSEARPGIEYFANTSTMEYQIERFGETSGAGTYDLHFMKTLYGRTLETFDERQLTSDEQQDFSFLTFSQLIPNDLVLRREKSDIGVHYTRLARMAKVFDAKRDCRPATDEEKANAKWRIVHGKVCAPSPKNHLAYEDMKTGPYTLNGLGGYNGRRWTGVNYEKDPKTKAKADLVRWQYRYGEDYSRGGYIHAKAFDSGADVYEVTVKVGYRFDLTYPWTCCRRQYQEFAWWTIPAAVDNNTFSRMRGYHWNTTVDIGRADAEKLADDDQSRPAVLASAEMFNFLQRVILTPEPGDYSDTTLRTAKRTGALPIFDLADGNGAAAPNPGGVSIGIIDGRFVQIDFDQERGGSWNYQQYPTHVGFDEEKVLAFRQLVDSRPTLSTVSRENALDGRDPYISFRTDTPQALDRLIGSVLSEDWETIGPTGLPTGEVVGFNVLNPDSTKLTRPASGSILFPNVGYANELGAGIYGLLYSRFSTDMTLATKMRIRIEGDAGPAIPEARKVAFTDPVSGNRYLATRFGTEAIQGRQVETGIASRMLQRANELLSTAYKVETDVNGLVLNPYGEPKLVLAGGQPVTKGTPEDVKALRGYIGLLDALRQVGNIYGGGPLGGGGGGGGGE
jgi:hypothetical protein